MTRFRTPQIIRLMTWAISTYIRGEKLSFVQGSHQLEGLGGIYIKFLQLIVINLDPADQEDYAALLSVYEHSKADDLDIRQYLRRELPADRLARFAHVEEQPFATGSFGQVYQAELTGGEQVVIKVLRPSVEKYLYYDLRLLRILGWAHSLLDRQNLLNFRSLTAHFRQTCLSETDYLREASVADHYWQTYRDHPYLVIPKTYLELSNRRVIVQDYVGGTSLTHLLEMQTRGGNAHEFVEQTLGSNLAWQLEVVGTELLGKAALGEVMHADPHPGNIIILPDNKVALIDFGMSTQLGENRYAFYEMLVQYVAFYSGNLAIDKFALSALRFLERDLYEAMVRADHLLHGAGLSEESIVDKVRSAVSEIFHDEANRPLINQLLARRAIMRVLFFAINTGNRFGFSFDLKAINLIKASQNYVVLVGQFDKEGVIAGNILRNAVAIAEANLERLNDAAPAHTDPVRSLETLSTWIDKMARNDPWLMKQLIGGYLQ
jgi:predicted unusual protein kinase regulating ubiquinone biosynthesis (AarF/ABC1/UbiB family)